MSTEKTQFSNGDIVNHIVAAAGCSKADATRAVALVTDAVVDTLAKEECQTLRLHKVGVFHKALRPARMGRNPKTGEDVQIEEKMGVNLRVAKQIKEAVNAA